MPAAVQVKKNINAEFIEKIIADCEKYIPEDLCCTIDSTPLSHPTKLKTTNAWYSQCSLIEWLENYKWVCPSSNLPVQKNDLEKNKLVSKLFADFNIARRNIRRTLYKINKTQINDDASIEAIGKFMGMVDETENKFNQLKQAHNHKNKICKLYHLDQTKEEHLEYWQKRLMHLFNFNIGGAPIRYIRCEHLPNQDIVQHEKVYNIPHRIRNIMQALAQDFATVEELTEAIDQVRGSKVLTAWNSLSFFSRNIETEGIYTIAELIPNTSATVRKSNGCR